MDEVIAATATGELTGEEGEKLVGMLSQCLKALETIELAQEQAELRAMAAAQLQPLLPHVVPQIELKQAAQAGAGGQGAVPVYSRPSSREALYGPPSRPGEMQVKLALR